MDVNMAVTPKNRSSNWICDLPILGPEDIAVDPVREVAYVSSQDRRGVESLLCGLLRTRSTDWTKRGGIFQVDLKSLRRSPMKMQDDLPADDLPGEGFHPCGIDFLPGNDLRRDRLFVVNWRTPEESSVEVFEIDGDELRWVASAKSDKLTLPNDIVALNEHQFYVTNTASRTPWLRSLETVLRLPAGSVLFHNLQTGDWTEVASGIPYANGIAIDRRRARLYVASTLTSKILAFPWDPVAPSKRLCGREEIQVHFLPDNLTWEDPDTLWVAGSELLSGMCYMSLLRRTAPSYVARIRLPDPRSGPPMAPNKHRTEPAVEPVYEDNGGEIAACSTAAPYKTLGEDLRFIVGACFDDHAIVCRGPVTGGLNQ